MVPIRLRAGENTIDTLALLDNGASLIRKDIAGHPELEGRRRRVQLAHDPELDTRLVDLTVSPEDDRLNLHVNNAFVVPRLGIANRKLSLKKRAQEEFT